MSRGTHEPHTIFESGFSSSSRFSRIAKGVDHEADDRDADAGIGDVEGWPGVGEANMQIEEKEIDHVTVQEAIGEVAENSGEKKAKGDAVPWIGRSAAKEQPGYDNKGDKRERDKEQVVILELTESRTGISDMD